MPQALLLSTVLKNLLTSDSQASRFQSSTQSQGLDDNRPHILSLPLLFPESKPPIQRFLFSYTEQKRLAYQWAAKIWENIDRSTSFPDLVCTQAQQFPNAMLRPYQDAIHPFYR